MEDIIGIDRILKEWDSWQIIDVRTPGEYVAGHIPGAINIPLFNDEERARIGTIYKQNSPEAGFKEGLDIAGTRMSPLLDAFGEVKTHSERIVIHCWRGGKRSQAVQWLFNFSGSKAYRLAGGYKEFRQVLQRFFEENNFQLRILGGHTGGGKTEILSVITEKGGQVIDLEKLAFHKGSAFGSIGEGEQPTTEQFENNLFLAFLSLDPQKPVWLENESKSIGKAHIPDGLWAQIRNSPLITIDVDKEIRLDRIVKYYGNAVNPELLKDAFLKIRKRLGGLDFQTAMKALDEKDIRLAASIALIYYDKAYAFQVDSWPSERVVYLEACNDVEETAKRLMSL